MAERYHKTPSQNSTPVLAPSWHLPIGYGEEHVASQHTIQVSVSSLPALLEAHLSPGSYPPHYPAFVQALVCFQGSGGSHTRAGELFPVCLWKKNAIFSTNLSIQASCLTVVSEGVLPFQCRGSLIGL